MTWLVKPLQKICILTFFVHDLSLTWPWPDLRSNFEIDLSTSRIKCSEPARQVKHDGVIFIFVSPISKCYQWKTVSVENDNFSWAKTVDLRSNMIKKRYWGMKRAIQCFFEFFLDMIRLELLAIVCEKSLVSQNLIFGDLWCPQYWPEPKMMFIKVWQPIAVYLMPFATCRLVA